MATPRRLPGHRVCHLAAQRPICFAWGVLVIRCNRLAAGMDVNVLDGHLDLIDGKLHLPRTLPGVQPCSETSIRLM